MSIYDIFGKKITEDVSLPFVNVSDFGAKGDGVTDDYNAIQNALDSVYKTGGIIFFPVGTYLISKKLTVYSNQIIELNRSTILQGAEINCLMMGYCTSDIGGYDGPHDIVIQNGIFDGGNYEVNNTLLGFCHGKDIVIRNCAFLNSYGAWHNIEINSSKRVLIESCIFEGSRKNNAQGEMLQFDGYGSGGTWPWGNGAIDNTICQLIEVSKCHFYDGATAPAIGNHSNFTAKDELIKIHDCTFENITASRGAISITAQSVDVYNNTFVGCTTGVGAGINSAVFNNRFVDVTTVANSNCTQYNNMVNGVLTP